FWNVGARAAIGAGSKAAIDYGASLIGTTAAKANLYVGAFAVGYAGGKVLYENSAKVRYVADTTVTYVGEKILGEQGFTDWSSHESWVDYINRPGGVTG